MEGFGQLTFCYAHADIDGPYVDIPLITRNNIDNKPLTYYAFLRHDASFVAEIRVEIVL